KRGPTIMGVGQSSGEDRAMKAATQAISSPLLDDLSIAGAQGILINITGPNDIGLEEVSCICNLVTSEAHPEAEIFHGVTYDDTLQEEGLLKVTVIATGLGCVENAANAENVAPPVTAVDEAQKVEELTIDEEVLAGAGATNGNILNYDNLERTPTRRAKYAGGETRRNRLANRYDSIPLDGDSLDSPTWLRLDEDNTLDSPTWLRRKAD
ncbi:MAG: hypothetical protein ACRCTY_01015, partial [Candidatus Adiutrix sp.]